MHGPSAKLHDVGLLSRVLDMSTIAMLVSGEGGVRLGVAVQLLMVEHCKYSGNCGEVWGPGSKWIAASLRES